MFSMADDLNNQLRCWIERVTKGLNDNVFKKEDVVDDFVWLASHVLPEPTGLLYHLGYSKTHIADHKSQQAQDCEVGSGLKPDFVVSIGGKKAFVVEDKKPRKCLSDLLKRAQIWDYMAKADAPLGLLFDAQHALLVINSKLGALGQEFSDLHGKAVLKASIDDPEAMITLLEYLKAKSSWDDYLNVAKSLGKQKLDENRNVKRHEVRRKKVRERYRNIVSRVRGLKDDAPDWLLEVITEKDVYLNKLRVKISEVRKAWNDSNDDLLDKDVIEVVGTSDDHKFAATFDCKRKTKMMFYDNDWLAPSDAAVRALRTIKPEVNTRNGWTFWKYKDPRTGQWLEIKKLQKIDEED